ncbi:MAG TPA: glycoside hydrolase family 88 protein [Polyangiaceae bacterium]|nr:glycoside hydrolase family 88 protein [Polyangiaceae bacterium]
MRFHITGARCWAASFLLAALLSNCSSSQTGDVAGAGAPGTAGAHSAGSSAGSSSAGSAGVAGGAVGNNGSAGANLGTAGNAGGATGSAGATLVTTGGSGAGGGSGAAGSAQAGASSCPTVSDFATWPSNEQSPLEIGKAAAKAFLPHTLEGYGGDGYAWAFTYFGALQFTKLTSDTATNSKLVTDFDQFLSGAKPVPANPSPKPGDNNVDTRAFGMLPLEVYLENGNTKAKELGLSYANMQWTVTTNEGYTADVRWWADDMFMITGLQVFAHRATLSDPQPKPDYLTRAAKVMIAYLAKLQSKTDGLVHHTDKSEPYWGRANGWIATGMTELLLELPAGADRDAIMAGYKLQMDGLVSVQITKDDVGTWNQVLDYQSATKPELSCTAMFTYALATGVKNGWLTDPKYAAAARKGWLAVAKHTKDGLLGQVCPGTGDARNLTGLEAQQKFYMDIAFQDGDRHGQAPLLWAARALLRQDCPGLR